MENFLLIVNYVAPIFIIIAIGTLFKYLKLVDESFVDFSSQIVFKVCLPALLFSGIVNANLTSVVNYKLVVFAYVGTLISYGIVWLLSFLFSKNGIDRSVFIQGSFRGNYAIIGLALISSLFGKVSLSKAALVLAFTIPLYNILSVICLAIPLNKNSNSKISSTLLDIIRNPLVIGVAAAIFVSLLNIRLPIVITKTVDYLADTTLPLALLGLGAFINFKTFKEAKKLAILATTIKLVIIPFVFTYTAYLMGFNKEEMGIVFVLFASPTAVASFIMAKAMGSNCKLAANILLLTTLFSAVTLTIGLFILKYYNLI